MAFRQPTLFAPASRHTAARDYGEAATPTTNEWVSRLSDFGSLNTVARSGQYDEEVFDEDEELDSLDDGLHAFREPSMYNASRRADQSGGSILPAHDGLGTFPASSTPVQQQLWSFEQYNPRRRPTSVQRRRSSVLGRLENVEEHDGLRLESTRIERIELWRIEQSKILLQEIEQETTRRRKSSLEVEMTGQGSKALDQDVSDGGQPNEVGPHNTSDQKELAEDGESFWQRITRRVIRDLMGIDDALLSIIFGESLPSGEIFSTTPVVNTSYLPVTPSEPEASGATLSTKRWEDQFLDRLARELGILIHQLSTHPRTLPTYPNPATMDYAGIPISWKPAETIRESPVSAQNAKPPLSPTLKERRVTDSSASEHAARWGIEDDENTLSSTTSEVEYWERTPDLKTVFGYLQRRFTSQQLSASSPYKSNIATACTPDSLRRAAIIRQHHPLVTRPNRIHERNNRRGSFQAHYSITHLSPGLKRAGTSCASASTKKSKRAESEASRNYWDIGGSIGSGSAIAGGAWGEA